MKKITASISIIILLCSFNEVSLKGVWQYCGGIYNGKASDAPTEYTLQRKYKKKDFEAFLIEPDTKPVKYEKGDYTLMADTCVETQTWCRQPSKTTGIAIPYTYTISNDTLIFKGVLPNGTTVTEYWKKVK